MKRFLNLSVFLSLFIPLLVAAAAFGPQDAEACRDCSFPLRVDSGRWVMPNGQLEIEIRESAYTNASVYVVVILRDARTRSVLAAGRTVRSSFKNNFTLDLEDVNGAIVRAQIRWLNRREEKIQTKFTCIGNCAISARP